VDDGTLSIEVMSERQIFIGKLTKCWSDCASVLVIEQRSPVSLLSFLVDHCRYSQDGWTPFIGAFGRQSWQRLRSESGRLQVGLHFMLNVAKLDGNAFGVSCPLSAGRPSRRTVSAT